MRTDAQANRDRLLVVAGAAITEHGIEASMRDIARQAGVGLATLLRHFPTREALLEALLRNSFDELTARADEVEAISSPQDALRMWLREFVACITNYRGVVTSMMQAIDDPESALHTSCVTMRASGTRLLTRAQEADVARTDLDGADLFALASSLAWLGDQPGLQARAEHLFEVVVSAILTDQAGVRRANLSGSHAGELPTGEEIRAHGDVLDTLRPDWLPGRGLSHASADALAEARDLLARATQALSRAAD